MISLIDFDINIKKPWVISVVLAPLFVQRNVVADVPGIQLVLENGQILYFEFCRACVRVIFY